MLSGAKKSAINGVFNNAISFSQPLGNWNISQVSFMQDMSNEASGFNKSIHQAGSFDQSIGNWRTSNVEDMNLMFSEAASCNCYC